MQRPASATLFRFLLAGALGAAVAPGCSGRDETRGAVKAPSFVPSAAPSATAALVPQAATPLPPPSPPPPAPSPPDPFAPLSADLARALAAIPADPAPAKITLNTHYVVSNEDKQQVFHDAAAGRGGVYVGVGAEQSFLFGGWARAELLFLMDFDDWVVDINEVHGLVFEHTRTPDEYFAQWGPEHQGEVKAWIEERTPDGATRERRLKVYEQGRSQVHYRLKLLRNRFATAQKPFFANDQAEFDHVARLWRNKRVRCVRGDLTASGALRAFGELARRAGWVVRMLYMSNAELYFSYDKDGFRENLRSLPFDERSIILHTHPLSPTEYYYIWQEAPSYVRWAGRVRNFRDLLYEAKLSQLGKLVNGAYLIEAPAPP